MNSKSENAVAAENTRLPDTALEDVAGAGFIDDAGALLKTAGQEVAHYGAVVVGTFSDIKLGENVMREKLTNYVDGKTGRK